MKVLFFIFSFSFSQDFILKLSLETTNVKDEIPRNIWNNHFQRFHLLLEKRIKFVLFSPYETTFNVLFRRISFFILECTDSSNWNKTKLKERRDNNGDQNDLLLCIVSDRNYSQAQEIDDKEYPRMRESKNIDYDNIINNTE